MRTLILAAALIACGSAYAQESNGEYWNRENARYAPKRARLAEPVETYQPIGLFGSYEPEPSRNPVADRIASEVSYQLGSQWVDTALRIARLESGYNCRATGPRTRHGRAKGVFQMLDGSARALGYRASDMHDCETGIAAGVAHMQACLQSGVQTDRQMLSCHVSGWAGWDRRLKGRSERYRQKYIRMGSR